MPRILGLEVNGDDAEYPGNCRNSCAGPPVDAFAGQAMQNEQPCDYEWSDDMEPVSDLTAGRIPNFDQRNTAGQNQPRDEQQQRRSEERVTRLYCPAVRPVMSVADVNDAVNNERDNHDQAENQVSQEHVLIKEILIRLLVQPFNEGDTRQIKGIDKQQGKDPKDRKQQFLESGTDDGQVSP